MRTLHIAIAVIIHSFDRTLQWEQGSEKAGAQGISIAVIIHSFDRTLQDNYWVGCSV